jgi:hypothetical protein
MRAKGPLITSIGDLLFPAHFCSNSSLMSESLSFQSRGLSYPESASTRLALGSSQDGAVLHFIQFAIA